MLEVGKLYTSEEHFLMLYPDQKTAREARSAGVRDPGGAAATAHFWSNRFGKNVSYTEKNIPLLVLDSKVNFYEVLAGDLKGWIIYRDWLEIREIEQCYK